MTVASTIAFGIASVAIILVGIAGFGVSELARGALRSGIAPGFGSEILREQSPARFFRAVTLCFIFGNLLLVVSAAGAMATGVMLYQAAR